MEIEPLLGLSKSDSKWRKVDFPEPEGPTSAITFPGSILRLTLFNTLINELLF